MKKMLALSLSLLLLSGCGTMAKTQDRETVLVFAASSLIEPLSVLEEQYEKEHPETDVLINYDSSGTLKTQIESGASCDVFLSAAQKQMDGLEQQGLIRSETRTDLVENQVVLVVPAEDPPGIHSFEDLASESVTLISVGNGDVPAGQYAREVLENLGLWSSLQMEGKLSYGASVKEVVSQVASGSVDCGIVYATDAAAAGLPVVSAAPEDTHSPVKYPAAVLRGAEHGQKGDAFLTFLTGEAGAAVFRSMGFRITER